jgi:hypothetical protein
LTRDFRPPHEDAPQACADGSSFGAGNPAPAALVCIRTVKKQVTLTT